MPLVVDKYDLYDNGPAYELWSYTFRVFYHDQTTFVLFVIMMFLAYAISIFSKFSLFKGFDRPFEPNISLLALLFCCIVTPILIYQSRAMFVSGVYGLDTTQALGPLATLNMTLTILVLNFIDYSSKYFLKILGFVLLLIVSITLLMMGGRMYVVIPLIALTIQYLNNNKSLFLRYIYLGIVFFIISVLVTISIWRASDSDSNYLAYFLSESVLTSISMANVASCTDINLISIPYNFFSSVINFIPSSLFPEKLNYMFSLEKISDCYYSPLGATNIYAAMLLNFGLIGSFFWALAFFCFLRAVSRVKKGGYWFYYYLCSLLPFMLYRDGFLIFNKAMILTGIIFPLFMYIIGYGLNKIFR